MSKNNKVLYQMILCAIFSALAFAGAAIHIPLPTGGMIHLGNFICLMAAVLCGPIVGGISGALGMGLYDGLIYYGSMVHPGTFRTIILKFIIGFVVGYLFRLILKKKINNSIFNYSLLGVYSILFVLSIVGCVFSPIAIGSKELKVNVLVPVFLGILVALYILVIIFDKKLNKFSKVALSAISVGISINILGEIFLKALLYYWMLSNKYNTFNAALIYAVSGIPSTVLTSTITCILAAFVIYPVYKGTCKINKYDDIAPLLDDYFDKNELNID